MQAGPLFGTRKYHDYFYAVHPQFASAERQRTTRAAGTRVESSPLTRRDYAVMAGVALAWVFAESERKVEVDVDD